MKRITTFFLSFVLTFSLMPSTHFDISAAAPDDEYRILFLSSYSYGWDTVQIQIEGIKKGISQGISQGIMENSIAIAKKLLSRNNSKEEVAEITGLKIEEIEKLQ